MVPVAGPWPAIKSLLRILRTLHISYYLCQYVFQSNEGLSTMITDIAVKATWWIQVE